MLDLALYLNRLGGLVSEPFDKPFSVFYHFLLIAVCGTLLLTTLTPKQGIFCIGDPVIIDFAEADFNGATGHIVEECAVMGDKDHCPGICLKELLEPHD